MLLRRRTLTTSLLWRSLINCCIRYGCIGSDGVGAFLTLARNGLEALDLVDLKDMVGDLGMDTPAMKLISTGRELAAQPMPARTVARTDL